MRWFLPPAGSNKRMNRTSTKYKRWIVTGTYALVILYLSTMEMSGEPLFPHFDKLAHFVMYGGLGFLFAWSLRTNATLTRTGIALLSFALATLYGVLTEVIQNYVPTRTMELLDMASNTAGALAGAALALSFRFDIEAREAE